MKINGKLKGVAACTLLALMFAACTSSRIEDQPATDAEVAEADKSFTGRDDLFEDAASVLTPNSVTFTGTSSMISHNFETILMKSRGRTGSFNIYALSETGTEYPVFSTVQEYTGSSFYLMDGRNVYKLSGNQNIKTASVVSERGMKIQYEIPGVALVTLDFEAFASVSQGIYDMIKVTAIARNLGTTTRELGLKVVLDTVLGEKTKVHFTDPDEMPIQKEVLARDTSKYRLIQSRNDKAVLQLVFEGSEATKPEFISIGNHDTLDTTEWEPNMLKSRSFNTVTSYNNTAVGVNWPKQVLLPAGELVEVFYMGVSTVPSFLDALAYAEGRPAARKRPASMDIPVEIPVKPVAEKTEPKVITEDPGNEPLVPVKQPAVSEKRNSKNTSFDVDSITEEQLSPDYIQNLLDRIANLEESDSTMNREELLLLNNELDVILQKLRM